MGYLSLWKMVCIVFVFCAATAIASPAQTFTTVATFDGTNGANPYYMSLLQGTDGSFYGPTAGGGADSDGTLFRVTPGGKLNAFSLDGADGIASYSTLVLTLNGAAYGTTTGGGTSTACTGGCGTVFKGVAKVHPKLFTLYNFCSQPNCTDGAVPVGGLAQAPNGNFYGTAAEGGINGGGTFFKITAAGNLTTLYSFCSQTNCADGSYPLGGLVLDANGDLYGTTDFGANSACTNGCGTVFKITPAGGLTTLHSFDGADGAYPNWLVQATDGNFYGTTTGVGVTETCTGGCGTIFKITPAGKLTTLYNFCSQTNCADGFNPGAGVVQATDGNFYGTTDAGGAYGYGTVFEISQQNGTWTLTTLHSFCSQTNCTDGEYPNGLVQGTDGTFYGTAVNGGDLTCFAPYGCGTVFSLSIGLGPFVETEPSSGRAEAPVIILGNGLTGSTGVSFNGTAATFTVVSDTEITTTVPTGATTGTVEVTTPSGPLESNVAFRVP